MRVGVSLKQVPFGLEKLRPKVGKKCGRAFLPRPHSWELFRAAYFAAVFALPVYSMRTICVSRLLPQAEPHSMR